MDGIGAAHGQPVENYPPNMSATLSLVVQGHRHRPPAAEPWNEDHSYPVRTHDVLFSTTLERDETIDNFGERHIKIVCSYMILYKSIKL